MSQLGLFSGTWAPAVDPGFDLTTSEVPGIAKRLPGLPITVNHNGLQDAVSRVDSAGRKLTVDNFVAALKKQGGTSLPVGKIVHTGTDTDVIFSIDPSFSGLQELIRSGLFNGLSLTHVTEGGVKMPLEISLTSDPARKNSTVLQEYKPCGLSIVKLAQPKMSAEGKMDVVEPTTPAADPQAQGNVPAPTPLEAMMSKLSDADQKIFLGRLEEYEKATTELKAKVEAETQKATAANELLAQRNADKSIVSDQIKYLRTLLEQHGGADAAASLEDVPAYLEKDSLPHTHMALERVVTACSRALAGAGVGARPAKRRAVDAAPQKAPAASAGPATAGPAAGAGKSSEVRNLLRSQFDGF